MNDFYSCSSVVLAHGDFGISIRSLTYLLIAISLFVFGPLLLRKLIRMPKGLFISSFISYVLILIIIYYISFDFQNIMSLPCFFVMFPNLFILGFIERVFGQMGAFSRWIGSNEIAIIYLATFIMNTLYIFVIVRLILYIKDKVSSKKSAAGQ